MSSDSETMSEAQAENDAPRGVSLEMSVSLAAEDAADAARCRPIRMTLPLFTLGSAIGALIMTVIAFTM